MQDRPRLRQRRVRATANSKVAHFMDYEPVFGPSPNGRLEFMGRSIGLSDRIEAYLAETGFREHPALVRCRAETAELPMALMQISAEQGAFMALLAKAIGATRYLEIGTFTGYSALAVALALPANGRVVACDVSKEFTDRAREYWKDADVTSKIDLRLAPAVETLDGMIEGKEKPFDMAFIDADKPNYDSYYERVLNLIRPGGLILLDNMLWSGAVADPGVNDANTEAIRALNRKVHNDPRVDMALAAIGDGVMMVRKR
jgi:predicted O-methyltransferase YrrM